MQSLSCLASYKACVITDTACVHCPFEYNCERFWAVLFMTVIKADQVASQISSSSFDFFQQLMTQGTAVQQLSAETQWLTRQRAGISPRSSLPLF